MSLVPVKDIPKETQMIIANSFLIGQKVETIAYQNNMTIDQVRRILADDNVQKYLDKASSNVEMQMHLKRIARADELMDSLLNKIEDFLADDTMPASKWKDSHVTLMKDVLLGKLPQTISKTIGLAIQMNFGKWGTHHEVDETGFKEILDKLEPGQVIIFREIIDKICDLFKSGNITTINKISELLNTTMLSWSNSLSHWDWASPENENSTILQWTIIETDTIIPATDWR